MKSIIYFLAIIMVVTLGCGIKGPPLPPIETIDNRLNSAQPVSGDVSTSETIKGQPK